MVAEEVFTCPRCLNVAEVRSARVCDHIRPTPVCPHCCRCSCGTAREVRLPEASPGGPVRQAWEGGGEPDPELRRAVPGLADLRVVPVGIEDGILYAWTDTAVPGLHDKVFRAVLEAGLGEVRAVRLAVRRPLPFEPRPSRPLAGGDPDAGLGWDEAGRLGALTETERELLRRFGVRLPWGWTAPIYCVEVEGRASGDRPVRAAPLRVLPRDLAAVRRWLGGVAAALVVPKEDGWLLRLARAAGWAVVRSRPAAWSAGAWGALVTASPRGLVVAAWPPWHSDGAPEEEVRPEVVGTEACACGACAGFRFKYVFRPDSLPHR